jgi:hypothetical protein
MPRRLIDLRGGEVPLLDIVSHARRGFPRRDRLSREQIEHITLTVRRAPLWGATHNGTWTKPLRGSRSVELPPIDGPTRVARP